MRLHLNHLLKLQLFYAFLALLFNIISCLLILEGGSGLTPTDPKVGMVAMFLYASCLLPAKMNRFKLYRGLMVLAVLLFAYSGIVKHILVLSQSPEVYFSLAVGILAIGINLFGLCLNLMAALGKFK